MERHEQINMAHITTKLQPLENYAKCLSHELRTPMHGIVGLLDLMQATVDEASMKVASPGAHNVFMSLKRDLEAVQESSRRAIDAADNLVQAVELSYNLPSLTASTPQTEFPPEAQGFLNRNLKRRSSETDCEAMPIRKFRITGPTVAARRLASLPDALSVTDVADTITSEHLPSPIVEEMSIPANELVHYSNTDIGFALHFTNITHFIKDLVNEMIKREAKPYSMNIQEYERGQQIHAQVRRGSNAEIKTKTISWNIESSVPDCIKVEHRDLTKILACIISNSIKFTDEGCIDVLVTCSQKDKRLIVNVKDEGPGISQEFRSRLFKPFSQQDSSITRQKEGLGLGLLVAKGLTRKLHGELTLVCGDTEGPNRGTEFRLSVPFSLNQKSQVSSAAGSTITSPKIQAAIPFTDPSQDASKNVTSLPTPAMTDLSPPPTFRSPQMLDRPAPTPITPARTSAPPYSPDISPFDISRPPYSIWAAQEPPQVSLPTPSALPEQRRGSHDVNRDFASSHPLNFLVVEDNAISRRLLVNMLKKLGYDAKTQIREACDGLEAVRLIQASVSGLVRGRRCSSAPPSYSSLEPDLPTSETHKEAPTSAPQPPQPPPSKPVDVILMDLWMPNLDGYEASRQILQVFKDVSAQIGAGEGSFSPPLILAVTADATQQAVEKAVNAGMEGLVLKPFRLKDLEKIVKENVTKRQMQSRYVRPDSSHEV